MPHTKRALRTRLHSLSTHTASLMDDAPEPPIAVAVDAAAGALSSLAASANPSTLETVNAQSDAFVQQLAVSAQPNHAFFPSAMCVSLFPCFLAFAPRAPTNDHVATAIRIAFSILSTDGARQREGANRGEAGASRVQPHSSRGTHAFPARWLASLSAGFAS